MVVGILVSAKPLLAAPPPVQQSFKITFSTGAEPVPVEAEEIRGRIWVNFSKIAPLLGASSRQADGGELWEFPDHDLLFWGGFSNYRIREKGQKKWKTVAFERNMFYDGASAMVLMTSLPDLCRRSLSYHRQRRALAADAGTSDATRGRRVPARHERRDANDWVSLDDTAKALGIVIINSQPNRFRLVMPDFTIQEVRTGETTVFQRNVASSRLPDPVLLFGGSPFLTVRSLRILFGTDVSWDAASGTLLVPARFGRLASAAPTAYTLRYRGYAPEPFGVRIDELSAYYQEPAPVYAADNPDVYESVRDLLTDQPIERNTTVEERINGNVVAALAGNIAGAPLSGRGAFERIGGVDKVVNGSVRMGFPLLQVQGGREYLTFGGLVGQFTVVDDVNVSHSNDAYGDGDRDFTLDVKAGYGRHDFSMFLSTAAFSQTVHMDQRYVTAGLEGAWVPGDGQRLTAKLNHFSFTNKPIGIDSSYFDEELLKEIFGDDFTTSVDPKDAAALTDTALSDRHDTTLLNLIYDAGRQVQLSGALGVSRYDGDKGAVTDSDGLVRLILGGTKQRIDASFERSGANYRSIGDPSRYQNRKILRLSPQLEIMKPWRVYAEYRREDNAALKRQGVAPYTNTYSSLTNLFTFRPLIIRGTLTDFDSTLYGRRLSSDVNLTKPLGRNSIELGGGQSTHELSTGDLFRRSWTARAGFQFLRPGTRFSVGQEYTRHDYVISNLWRIETQTTAIAEIDSWRLVTQYSRAPKNYTIPETLHTGYFAFGRHLSDQRLLNVFYSAAGDRANLSHALVWRSGIELTTTFQ